MGHCHALRLSLLFGAVLAAVCGKEKDTYTLQLNNTGPSVIDSNLAFHAKLIINNTEQPDLDQYFYTWKDNAIHPCKKEVTFGNLTTELVRTFNRYEVDKAGSYSMTVMVYKRQKLLPLWATAPLAVATTNFSLTDWLNMDLNLSQPGPDHRPPYTYATHHPILATARVLENFTDPTSLYTWHVNNQTLAKGVSAHLNVMYNDTGPQYLGVEAEVSANVTDLSGDIHTVTRTRLYKIFLELKDPVMELSLPLNTSLEVGETLQSELTCTGSPPFSLQWSIEGPVNDTGLSSNSTSQCQLTVAFNTTKPGNYTVYVRASNEVSRDAQEFSFLVNDSELVLDGSPIPLLHSSISAPTASALPPYLPVVCVLIGLVALLALYTAYRRDRATASGVETANFNFHDSQLLHMEPIAGLANRLERWKESFKQALASRDRREGSMVSRENNRRSLTTSVTYGSLDKEDIYAL